jgi:hypothetical protein
MAEETRKWTSGAVRDSNEGKPRPDLIPAECLWRLGWLYKKGCDHYGPHNWEKGIPTESFIESAERHWLQYKMGQTVDAGYEDHLASLVFNIFGIMFNENHDIDATLEADKDIDPAWRFDAKCRED